MTANITVGIDEGRYHADDLGCPRPTLSASLAKVIVEKSPKHAYMAHPRLGGLKQESRKELDYGTLVHKLVLGTGPEIVLVDADDWRTKAAQEARDSAAACGKLAVLTSVYDAAESSADTIVEELRDLGAPLVGDSEVTVQWTSYHEGVSVACRARMDHLVVTRDRAIIIDLKTSRNAHPAACTRHILGYGYDIQRAAYVEAIETAYPHLAGRVQFIFAFAETEPFVSVTPGVLDGVMEERGRRRWAHAVMTWARCLDTQFWPSYAERVLTFESPSWLISQMEQEDHDAEE